MLHALLDYVPDAVVIVGNDGLITMIDARAEALFGYPNRELVGKPIELLIPERSRGAHLYHRAGYLSDASVRSMALGRDVFGRHRNGSELAISIILSPLTTAEGTVTMATIRSRAERQEIEGTLKRFADGTALGDAAVRLSLDAIVGMDGGGEIVAWSPAAERTFGYSREEAIGKLLGNVLVPEPLRDPFQERMAHLLLGGAGSSLGERIEVPARRRDGTELPVEVTIAAISASSFIAFIRDVSERKSHEAALRASEVRFRKLYDSGIIGIGVTGPAGSFVEANDAFLRMVGYSRSELLAGAVRWDGMTPTDQRAKNDWAVNEVRARGAAGPWEKEYICKDKSRIPVLVGVAALDDATNIAFVTDLTELKRTERALQLRVQIAALIAEVGTCLAGDESESVSMQRYAETVVAYLNVASVRVWICNDKLKVLELQANAGTKALRDTSLQRIAVGQGDIGRIAEERRPHLTNDAVNDASMDDREWVRSEGMVAFAGLPLAVGETLVGVIAVHARTPFSETATAGLASIADAIAAAVQHKRTESSAAALESQLRQSQKMDAVGRLAGGIAHDFNNLLSVVLSYTEMMIGECREGDPLRADLEEVHKAGRRAADLTRQLLMFSRQQTIAPKILDMDEIIVSMDRMLRRVIGEDVELVTLPRSAAGRVKVDPGSIEQIVVNLAANARDAMPTGGKLTIETAGVELDKEFAREHLGVTAGPHVMLSVSDTGTGMEPATLARIFEPFYTTKKTGKGTGLGLSTVFGLVQQAGGSIWVASEAKEGTVFRMYFPRLEENAVPMTGPITQPTMIGSETILLVEDEAAVRSVARSILQRAGYKVLECGGADEALQACTRHTGTIHLLLTDVVMPKVSGADLAKQVVQLRPEIKVLYMSGYTNDSVLRRGVVESGVAFVQKPITPEMLTRKIRDVLDAKRD